VIGLHLSACLHLLAALSVDIRDGVSLCIFHATCDRTIHDRGDPRHNSLYLWKIWKVIRICEYYSVRIWVSSLSSVMWSQRERMCETRCQMRQRCCEYNAHCPLDARRATCWALWTDYHGTIVGCSGTWGDTGVVAPVSPLIEGLGVVGGEWSRSQLFSCCIEEANKCCCCDCSCCCDVSSPEFKRYILVCLSPQEGMVIIIVKRVDYDLPMHSSWTRWRWRGKDAVTRRRVGKLVLRERSLASRCPCGSVPLQAGVPVGAWFVPGTWW
jgi:hypothetical protein